MSLVSKKQIQFWMTKLKSNILEILPILTVLPVIFLAGENLGKAIFISMSLIVWFVFSLINFRLKRKLPYVISAIYLLAIVSFFNITFQFDSLLDLTQQKVAGIYVNWLIPTISIIDIFVGILFYELIIANFKQNIFKKNTLIIVLLGICFLIINLIFHPFLITLISTFRVFLYLVTVLLLVRIIRQGGVYKEIKISLIVFLLGLLLQIIISNLQIIRGASLGLDWLGESRLILQVYGVAFINIFDTLVLRGYGTFPHPNVLSLYLLFGMIIVNGISIDKKVAIFLSALFFTGLILTFSKIAIFVGLLILLLSFLLKAINDSSFMKDNRFQKFYSIFWIVTLSVLPCLLYAFQYFNIPGLNLNDNISWLDRHNLLNVAISTLKEDKQILIFGTGAGRFIITMGEDMPITSGGFMLLQPVHNIFILMLIEYGFAFLFVGLLVFAIFTMNLMKMSLKTYFHILVLNLVNLINNRGWLLFTILIIFLGSFDHYLITLPQGLIILAIYLGYSIFLVDFRLKEEHKIIKNDII